MDLHRLKEPFPVNDHKLLQGYWYLKEFAIAERLDAICGIGMWSITTPHPIQRITQNHYVATVELSIFINGMWVSRTNVGEGTTAIRGGNNPFDFEDRRSVETMAENTPKGALTDGFKRAARLWGIGRYILQFPNWVTNHTTLEKHLRLSIWEQIKTDVDIRSRYDNDQHLTNTLALYGGSVIDDGLLATKHWLLSRESSSDKRSA